MKADGRGLDRLLRSAAQAEEPAAPEASFGFATRVIASWRESGEPATDAAELTRFVRRIGAVALAVLALASAGAYRQFYENEQLITPQTNEYAIADSAIQTEFSP